MAQGTAFRLWAKTQRFDRSVDGDGAAHPLPCHLLDVAAVALMLLDGDPHLPRLADRLGCDASVLIRASAWLTALHDVGKASIAHQSQSEAHWPRDLLGPLPSHPGSWHHTVATQWYLEVPLAPTLAALLPGAEPDGRRAVIAAIAGHHGRPIERDGKLTDLQVGRPAIGAVIDMAEGIRELLGAAPLHCAWPEDGAALGRAEAALSWHLATLVPLADWLGSGPPFDPAPDADTLAGYWPTAQAGAERAVTEAGLTPPRPRRPHLSALLPMNAEPSSAQRWAKSVTLPAHGPVLAVLEDATGAGKTEAAAHLAHRMIKDGLGRGLHVALPTMATADAMHERLGRMRGALFEDEGSHVLVHGRARHRRSAEEPDVAAYCSDWIAKETRRAFFAATGAGTVDQAILGVLASKYQTLRLRGLADKILILDEVHAYDAYVSEEVQALLRFHAAQGGSAILLSATLPAGMRARLLAAFAEGAGRSVPAPRGAAYPLATVSTPEGLTETPLSLRRPRRVEVRRLPNIPAAERTALETARGGAAVALIRSTVDGAIASHDRLADEGATPMLFHARFLPGDRARIEQQGMGTFGKDSDAEGRRGRLLVATAVIEQSLDIDFDVLITDLAPVDLLIQRAGRLWRHDREGRPVAAPVLHVVSPEPVDPPDETWLEETLPEAVWVHRDAALLWRSARALFDAGVLDERTLAEGEDVAGHPRALIEAAYNDDATPAPLQRAADAAWGERLTETALARAAVLRPDIPYRWEGAPWADEARVVTRLGESVTVRLARRQNGVLRPMVGEGWFDAELRLGPRLSRDAAPPPEGAQLDPPWGAPEAGTPMLVMRPDGDGWIEEGGSRRYLPTRGLSADGGIEAS